MLHRAGTIIAAAQTPEASLQLRSGNDVSQELGGRLLVRYMLRKQVGQFASGSSVKHFVTPTPLARTDIGSVLALPNVTVPRRWAILIDPLHVADIQGPRWVRGGSGIEYILPAGFPGSAVWLGWEIEVK